MWFAMEISSLQSWDHFSIRFCIRNETWLQTWWASCPHGKWRWKRAHFLFPDVWQVCCLMFDIVVVGLLCCCHQGSCTRCSDLSATPWTRLSHAYWKPSSRKRRKPITNITRRMTRRRTRAKGITISNIINNKTIHNIIINMLTPMIPSHPWRLP